MDHFLIAIFSAFVIACGIVIYFYRSHLQIIASQAAHDAEVDADNLKQAIADGTAVYGQKADAVIKTVEADVKATVTSDVAKVDAEADKLKAAL